MVLFSRLQLCFSADWEQSKKATKMTICPFLERFCEISHAMLATGKWEWVMQVVFASSSDLNTRCYWYWYWYSIDTTPLSMGWEHGKIWKALVPCERRFHKTSRITAATEVLQGLGHIALVRLAAAVGGDGLRGGVLPGANSEGGNKWHAKRTRYYGANGFYWQVIRDTGVDVGHHIIRALPCAECIVWLVWLALCHHNVWYISLLYLGQTLFGSLYSTMTCAAKVENKWVYSSAFPTKMSCFTMLWSWGAGLTLAFLAFLHRLDYSRIHDVGMLELREKLGMHRLAIGNRTIRHNTSRPDVRRTLWFGERRANKIVHNVATMQHKGEDRLWVGSGDRWWTSSAYKSFE